MATELETLVVTLEASIKQYERQLARAQGTTVSVMRSIEGEVTRGGKRVSERMGETGRETANAFLKGFGLGRIGRGGIAFFLIEEMLRFARETVKVAADAGNESAAAFLRQWDAAINHLEEKVGGFIAAVGQAGFDATLKDLDNLIKIYNKLPWVTKKVPTVEEMLEIPGPKETYIRKSFGGFKSQDRLDSETIRSEEERQKKLDDARQKAIDDAEKQRDAVAKLNADLRFQQELLGKTALEQEILNNLKTAGVTAESDYGQAIIKTTTELFNAQQAQKRYLDQQKELFDQVQALGTSLETATDGLVDALLNGEKASKAFSDSLRALLKDLVRLGLNQVFQGLFGGGTQAGGGIFGDLLSRLLFNAPAGAATATPGPAVPVIPVEEQPIRHFSSTTDLGTSGALVSGTESSSSLVGGAGQDLLDALHGLEQAQKQIELGITHTTPLRFTPGGKIADRITPEQPDYPVYHGVGNREYLPLDPRETTYRPLPPDYEANVVKDAKVFHDAVKKTADITKTTADVVAPQIGTGLANVAKTITNIGAQWGNAQGFPILNSMFGTFASIGGAYEHSIPFGGFQHGGEFKVGGAGGTDSSLVAFKATPGEIVTVSPRRLAGQGGRGGIAIGGTVINVAGSADERTVEMLDRRIAANNYRQRKALERDWGAMSMRYQQLRG